MPGLRVSTNPSSASSKTGVCSEKWETGDIIIQKKQSGYVSLYQHSTTALPYRRSCRNRQQHLFFAANDLQAPDFRCPQFQTRLAPFFHFLAFLFTHDHYIMDNRKSPAFTGLFRHSGASATGHWLLLLNGGFGCWSPAVGSSIWPLCSPSWGLQYHRLHRQQARRYGSDPGHGQRMGPPGDHRKCHCRR